MSRASSRAMRRAGDAAGFKRRVGTILTQRPIVPKSTRSIVTTTSCSGSADTGARTGEEGATSGAAGSGFGSGSGSGTGTASRSDG